VKKPSSKGEEGTMKVSSPTVGPIIGYTTAVQCRLMIRGKPEREGTTFRRCFAVVRWRPVGSDNWLGPLFNKLSPNFDMSGVLVMSELNAETTYE
jgi:alkaline phosphatase D